MDACQQNCRQLPEEVALDGQSFYAMQWRTPPPRPVVTHINLIPNWFEELKARVPVKR